MISKIKLYFFVLAAILCSSVYAQSNFEGKVVMRVTGEEEDEKSDMDYYIKEDKIRMEIKSEEGKLIILYDQKDSKAYMIMPEEQMYMEFDNNFSPEDSNDFNSQNINRTGEFKDINGYKCEKWIIKEDDNITEAWMTDELGGFYMLKNPMAGGLQDSWQQKLVGNYFPLKVNVTEDGETTGSIEVLSVDKMSLNDDLFILPSGFQKFEMPNLDMYK
jgi:hypothetical protein